MIQIQNLGKSYGDLQVLKDISINISEGEIFGIIGHSGAGKSTLLRCINGLENYSSGFLQVIGKNPQMLHNEDLRNLRKDIGMIFQTANLMPSRSVYENVAFPLKSWAYDKTHIHNKVTELIELVGLKDKINCMPSSLSGGQKQRVSIARALSLDPKILLCDEATSALDPKTTKSILELLDKINKTLNITIVMVTHEMEVVKRLCTRMALMDKGIITSCGYVDNLFLSSNEHVENLLGDKEILPDTGANIKIFFTENIINKSLITELAHALDINVSITWGKLEQFREKVLGNLTINVEKNNEEVVVAYLKERNINFKIL